MPIREVPRAQWATFLDSFSRQHDGWLGSIDVTVAPGEPRRVVSDLPLSGVTFEQKAAGGHSISILMGTRAQRIGHTIKAPIKIFANETPEGVRSGLQIQSPDGAISQLSFRSPIAPELVDGSVTTY